MRPKFVSTLGISTLGIAAAAAFTLYGGASCLSVDSDRTCGEGHPPCYKGEVCHQGRCYERGEVPTYRDTRSRDSERPRDGDEADTERPIDTVDASDPDSSGDPPDAGDTGVDDGDAPTDSADGGSYDTSWPYDGSMPRNCRRLANSGGDGLRSLRGVWDRAPDAGIRPKAPGSPCAAKSDCTNPYCTGYAGGKKCAHVVFTTSNKYAGALGGLKGADCLCQQIAERAGRDGAWQAILSTPTTTFEKRLEFRAKIFNTAGTEVHESGLEGNIKEPLNWDEDGNEITGSRRALLTWTGWEQTGPETGEACSSWTSNSPNVNGIVGHCGKTDPSPLGWLSYNHSGSGPVRIQSCDSTYRLYCVQQ